MLSALTPDHIKFLIVRYHIEKIRPQQIHSELTDPDCLALYGVLPIPSITIRYLYHRIARIPNTTIEMVKAEWLNALMDVPLANKRVRLEELTKLYTKAIDVNTKRKILQDIKAEVGEDSWREAFAQSGKTTIKISLQEEMKDFLTKNPDESI